MTKLALNPWHPITDAVTLKHLGKLGEEAGELASAVSRCIIQGVVEREPVTGKINKEWLEDEIADVMANSYLVMVFLKLDVDRIFARAEKKKLHLQAWHKLA